MGRSKKRKRENCGKSNQKSSNRKVRSSPGMSDKTDRETLREILNGISDIKHTLNNVVSRIDEHDSQIKSLENDFTIVQNDIYDKNEYGGGRNILSCLKEGFNNVLVVVSRTFGQKLGAKRFTFFKNAARSAIRKVEYQNIT
ncbi:hypothetical protein KUTeg_010629 [Tegillarca granosa]|uniref:Impact N-terminal domain-containing protein n=1 Tax=Tegillarca granosa TaxID=220873 RepID=A0ABQ9F6I5_TEGGR|nr:hypothetical protein KUTeg_010629 [Tegillarca granosa]